MEQKFLPSKLLCDGKGSTIDDATFLDAKIKGLYFSAHWCPPCRRFTPMLTKVYKEVNKNSKEMEIVFVSFDKSKPDFEGYYKEMPWLAVPFDDQDAIKKLAKKYNVNGIPCLMIIDEKGKVLHDDGYIDIAQSSEPTDLVMSWKNLS
jgi:nucleoredoxin